MSIDIVFHHAHLIKIHGNQKRCKRHEYQPYAPQPSSVELLKTIGVLMLVSDRIQNNLLITEIQVQDTSAKIGSQRTDSLTILIKKMKRCKKIYTHENPISYWG